MLHASVSVASRGEWTSARTPRAATCTPWRACPRASSGRRVAIALATSAQPAVSQNASGREYVAISPPAMNEMAPANWNTAHRPPSIRGNWAWASSCASESNRYASSAPVLSANATPCTAPARQISAKPGA